MSVVRFLKFGFFAVCGVSLLSGCSRLELASHFGKKLTGSPLKSEGRYKVGSPYTIKGKRYYPAVDYNYNKKGVASWYGPNFHGKMTANGEIYNQNDLTAAHKTLPLPSIVRVTNLENGRSLVVRVNDRGPYAHSRIIDMSKRSAELLGFKNNGVAKVRVKVLEKESRAVAEAAKQGRDTRGMEIPMNKASYESPQDVPKVIKKQSSIVSAPKLVQESYVVDSAQSVYVQVGAFSTRESAMRHSSALDGYGRAQIYPTTINGRDYYRVRFPRANLNAANDLLQRLKGDGYQNAIVVKN